MNEKKIDDLVAMIDQFMAGNGGHMNITAENGSLQLDTASVKIRTTNSLECAAGNMACQVPTLFEGMDFPEEDPEHPSSQREEES